MNVTWIRKEGLDGSDNEQNVVVDDKQLTLPSDAVSNKPSRDKSQHFTGIAQQLYYLL
jgi:hypothetical protein